MQSKAATVDAYIAELPDDRREAVAKLRKIIKKHIPKGFKEEMGYGMAGWVVPHTLYPAGYHCDPKQALPFMGFASQKNSINLYHMGIYADADMLEWFQEEYHKRVPTRLDMGKSCIRFKKPEHIPYDLVAELVEKMTPQQWIDLYEANVKNPRKK